MNATITPQELQAILAANTATVCDVRRRADYEADPRTIPGAAWHDPELVDVWAAQLPKDKPVLLYCRTGNRSAGARDVMEKEGMTNILHMNEGIVAWQKAGLPLEK